MWGTRPRLHLFLVFFWLAMSLPTVIWFRGSVLWVSFLSLYALSVGHWAAYEAAKSGVQKGTLLQIYALADALSDFMEAYQNHRETPDLELQRAIDELRTSLHDGPPKGGV